MAADGGMARRELGPLSLRVASRLSVGGIPVDVIATDLDGDGVIDLATANRDGPGAQGASVLRGLGGGRFADPVVLSSGRGGIALTALDPPKPGAARDLVVLNSGGLVRLRADAKGAYGPPATELHMTRPVAIALGDLDATNRRVLVTADADGTITPIVVGADGAFTIGTPVAEAPHPRSIALADVDGDGNSDLLVVVANALLLRRGDGHGGFGPGATVAAAAPNAAVAAGDLDGDGFIDIAVHVELPPSRPGVAILRGRGNGTFDELTRLEVGSFGELAVTPLGAGAPSTLLVAGNNGVRRIELVKGVAHDLGLLAAGSGTTAVAVADLDADGRLDVMAANSQADDVSILRGVADGFWAAPVVLPDAHAYAMAIADLDGDGLGELLALDYKTPTLWLWNGRDQSTQAIAMPSGFPLAHSLAIGDLNEDGHLDVVAPGQTGVTVLYGDGRGGLTVASTLPAYEPMSVAIGDVDGDGHLDLVVAPDRLGVSVYFGAGDGTFPRSVNIRAAFFPAGIPIGDLNGDGKADFALSMSGKTDFVRLFGGGAMPTTLADLATQHLADYLAFADMDGDGALDVIGTGFTIWRGDNRGHLALSFQGPLSPAYEFALADLDQNGALDIVTTYDQAPSFAVHLGVGGLGTVSFAPPLEFSVGYGPMNVVAGDLDGDGLTDLAVANYFGVAVVRHH